MRKLWQRIFGKANENSAEKQSNATRAEQLIQTYGFEFERIPKSEIVALIEGEIGNPEEDSGEYLRVLCGYLFCVGNASDAPLLKKAKYDIGFDVGCMIDGAWIECWEYGDSARKRELENEFVAYCKNYFGISASQNEKAFDFE